MHFYVVYGIYGIYNLAFECVSVYCIMYVFPLYNTILWPTTLMEMYRSGSLIARYLYFPIVQGSVLLVETILILLMIYPVNRLYLSLVANAADPKKIAFLTLAVAAAVNAGWVFAVLYSIAYTWY